MYGKGSPTRRFSQRALYYARYRPGYPSQVMDLLRSECALTRSSIVADIGSGTGILTEMLLKNGNIVFAVEPNPEMRHIAERRLKGYPNLRSIDGTAESTTLAESFVDLITVAQAFHWFNPDKAGAEFRRILRQDGWVVLIWNHRRVDTTPFLRAYEDLLLRYGTDYQEVNPARFDYKILDHFFGKGGFRVEVFANRQEFGLEGIKGRLLSSSYVPFEGSPMEEMMQELERIFFAHQLDGKVAIEYDTKVYYGRLD